MNGVASTARILHLHIPKTAGTAFRSAFEKASNGTLRVFPYRDERQYAGINANQYDFFSGHFGFKTAARLGGQIITVLRNPVDRFVSVYYFWRQLSETGAEKSQKTMLAGRYSLAEFVKIKDEPTLLEAFYNTMTWQIAHGTSLALRRELRDMGKTDDDVFQLALTNLSAFSLVGVQERLALFENAVERQFSVPLKIKRENVTEARPAVKDIGVATIRAIQNWSFMDLELYQHAYKLVSECAI
jgi:hypothetical protein